MTKIRLSVGSRKALSMSAITQFLVLHESVHALADHAESFLDGLFERASDCHHLTHRLHAGAQLTVYAMELAQVPARNLAHHIVECRLKESRSGFGHRVLQVEQSVAQSQLGSHECQRITRSLRCQRRRTAQTRVHLDHTVIFRFGIERILHVALSHDTDVADDADSQFTELVVFTVGQRLARRNDNRLSRMDTPAGRSFPCCRP